jgi:hypothetical protein
VPATGTRPARDSRTVSRNFRRSASPPRLASGDDARPIRCVSDMRVLCGRTSTELPSRRRNRSPIRVSQAGRQSRDRPSRNCQSVGCAQAPSMPEGRAERALEVQRRTRRALTARAQRHTGRRDSRAAAGMRSAQSPDRADRERDACRTHGPDPCTERAADLVPIAVLIGTWIAVSGRPTLSS